MNAGRNKKLITNRIIATRLKCDGKFLRLLFFKRKVFAFYLSILRARVDKYAGNSVMRNLSLK